MRYLFSNWNKISSKIRKSRRVCLFFDYDGTLTPIVSRPELARISPRVKNLIRKLRKNPKFIIAIISGRSLKNVKNMVGVKGLIYAGNHGLEIEEIGREILKPKGASTKNLLNKIELHLKKELRHIKGVIVEDKGCTLSIHFRLVSSRKKGLVKKIFARIVKPYVISKKIRISAGKMVLEVRPGIDWDKGKAVQYLLGRHKKALPVYLGDDVTDRDAFRAIKRRGVSIFVGRPKKAIKADYFLKSPREVERFIKILSA
ncbi:MAG: trehalose-phosphatase [Candidatus Omnitrophica bacterium]|nr:trehalose-phosphatase [Candidatus Omnitrophota bacterium]